MKRREFLKLVGIVSGSVVSGCKLETAEKKLISYMLPPEEGIIPGVPYYRSSTCTECPAGCGVTVKLRDDRPVKLEGNPFHPVSEGTLCIRGQASISRLYHPERLKEPLYRKSGGDFGPVSWDRAIELIRTSLGTSGEEGLANFYLSGRTTGTLSPLIRRFCETLGFERPMETELFHYGASRKAYELLFGRYALPAVHMGKADLWVTCGADLFETFINPVHFSREFAKAQAGDDFDWIHLEPHFSLTGASAQDRLTIKPGSESYLLTYLLHRLGERRLGLRNREALNSGVRNPGLRNEIPGEIFDALPEFDQDTVTEQTGLSGESVRSILERVVTARQPVFLAGGAATAHEGGLYTALVTGLLQWITGSVGEIVDFSSREDFDHTGTLGDFETLAADLRNRRGGVVILSRVHGVPLETTLEEISSLARMGVALTDTLLPWMKTCTLLLPLSHSLESWGDVRSRVGVQSLIQPVIDPLYNTLTEGDILLKLLGDPKTYQEHLFTAWEGFGENWIDTGVRVETPAPATVSLQPGKIIRALKDMQPEPRPSSGEHLFITPSVRTFDGRSRMLTLLEEIPDPLTTVSYGDWISVSSQDADLLAVTDGDEITLTRGQESVTLPVGVLPGLPPSAWMVTIDKAMHLDLPVDQRTGELIISLGGFEAGKSGNHLKVPVLSGSRDAAGRGILPNEGHGRHHQDAFTLYPEHGHTDYLWGMAIDLDACIGCSACVAACYIENNIPLTGYREHLKGREMSWIRISPYLTEGGGLEFIPVMCQQCEHAPCEPVCPVYATYHNPEGLNAQIYNRCVGTRYCANNCPYKARRFNWLDHELKEPLPMMLNPDVSKRPKGVMEKCTFCIQRIRYARGKAKDEQRLVEDGEITPACAQTCPTGAITFGNLLDENSRISKLSRSPEAYRILEQLGTRPSVYYLKKAGRKHES